jgi:hypothetical protein
LNQVIFGNTLSESMWHVLVPKSLQTFRSRPRLHHHSQRVVTLCSNPWQNRTSRCMSRLRHYPLCMPTLLTSPVAVGPANTRLILLGRLCPTCQIRV